MDSRLPGIDEAGTNGMMRVEVLHLDEGLTHQAAFLGACAARDATVVHAEKEAAHVRLWGRDAGLDRLAAKLPRQNARTLSFFGSGDFHHVTALLLRRLAEVAGEPFTLVHFDNHPDWVRFNSGIHCGSWVNGTLAMPQVAKVITVGVCSKDLQHPEWKRANLDAMRDGNLELFAYEQAPSAVSGQYGSGAGYRQDGNRIHWTSIADIGLDNFSAMLLSRIETKAVYVTLDKDVLSDADAVTNWDQGRMRLDEVTGLIEKLGADRDIIGADVIGDYSPVTFAGPLWPRIKKAGETAIDHARVRLSPESVAARNEAANLRLLAAFTELMQ